MNGFLTGWWKKARWGCQTGTVLVDDGELRETKGDLGLMRYGGVGCLERQPGSASDNRLIGLGNGVWSKVDCWRHSGTCCLERQPGRATEE